MAKAAPDVTLDQIGIKVATGTRLTVCSAQPANFAGIAAVLLASVVMTAGVGNGDYTAADGDTSGRKLTVLQQTNMSITASGSATHVCIDDGTTLLYVTTCTSQALTSGGTVTVPAWDIETSDPT
jgi:hypothetical protein